MLMLFNTLLPSRPMLSSPEGVDGCEAGAEAEQGDTALRLTLAERKEAAVCAYFKRMHMHEIANDPYYAVSILFSLTQLYLG